MAYTWKWHTVDVVTCALNILNHNVAVAVICDNDKFPSNLSPDTIYDTVACVIHKEAIATRLCLELFSNPMEGGVRSIAVYFDFDIDIG